MHGIIFSQLTKFVKEHHGTEVLNEIAKEAGVSGKIYLPIKAYPDAQLIAMVEAACKILSVNKDALLESFGRYITPELIKTYGALIKKEWGVLDLLEHIENTMHKVVRGSNPGATPPKLKIERVAPNQVVIEYTSERKMIALGIGIIKALAEHYADSLIIERSSIPHGTSLRVTQQSA